MIRPLIFFIYIVFLTLDNLLKPLISGRRMSLIQKLKQNRFKVGSAIFAGDLGCVLFDFFSYNILFETDPRYLFKNVEINICFFREIHSFSQHWNHCAHTSRNLQIFFFIIRKEAFSHFLRHAEGFFAVKPPSNDFLISLCVFFSKSLMSIPYIHFKVNTLPKIILALRFGIIAAGRVNWTPSHNSFSFFIAEVLVETNNSRHFNLGNTTLLDCWIL